MKHLYEIIFIDGERFVGGTIQKPNWLQIPNKGIKKLIYSLPNGKKLICEDYKTYYHFVEVCQDIVNGAKGRIQIEYAYLITGTSEHYEVLKINLSSGESQLNMLKLNDDWISQLNPLGWKNGI
jgi:hypothetical protein